MLRIQECITHYTLHKLLISKKRFNKGVTKEIDNLVVTQGIFAGFRSTVQFADVSQIFKRDEKHYNYRPVSVLSSMSKIFGRLMPAQINDYMKDKLSIFLCGFRKGMTHTAYYIWLRYGKSHLFELANVEYILKTYLRPSTASRMSYQLQNFILTGLTSSLKS